MILRFIHAIVCLLLSMHLAGCQPAAQARDVADHVGAQASAAPGHRSVMTDGVNYMHERAVKYTLYDLSPTLPKPVGGAVVDMLIAGGEKGCCLSLPDTWRPGMKVRVVWAEADRQQTFPGEHTRDLEIPRYDEAADLYLVFYGQQDVEVVVSKAEPGHPDWRGRVKQTPWEHCLAHHERKVCKAALPKQFDTRSSQGFCTYLHEANDPEATNFCAFSMDECMRDYQDDAFCKGILWGPRKK